MALKYARQNVLAMGYIKLVHAYFILRCAQSEFVALRHTFVFFRSTAYE